jgi:hypothetical protein
MTRERPHHRMSLRIERTLMPPPPGCPVGVQIDGGQHRRLSVDQARDQDEADTNEAELLRDLNKYIVLCAVVRSLHDAPPHGVLLLYVVGRGRINDAAAGAAIVPAAVDVGGNGRADTDRSEAASVKEGKTSCAKRSTIQHTRGECQT